MEASGIALLDDKFDQYYYVPANHIRLIPNEELSPLSPNVPDESKRVEVRLDDQLVLAYENGQIVFATRISTGGKRLERDIHHANRRFHHLSQTSHPAHGGRRHCRQWL